MELFLQYALTLALPFLLFPNTFPVREITKVACYACLALFECKKCCVQRVRGFNPVGLLTCAPFLSANTVISATMMFVVNPNADITCSRTHLPSTDNFTFETIDVLSLITVFWWSAGFQMSCVFLKTILQRDWVLVRTGR